MTQFPLKNLSPSKVDCFHGCQRLFYYRYLESPFDVPQNKYFLIGNVAHKALELFHQNLKGKPIDYGKLMSESFKKSYTKYSVDKQAAKGFLSQQEVQGIHNMLAGYLAHIKANGHPWTMFIEKMFKTEVGGITVRGKADRVDRIELGDEEPAIKIVDYKTSSKPLSKKQVARSVQLPTYAMWIREMDKIPDRIPIYGEYVYLKHMGTKQESKCYLITDEMFAEAIEKYTRVVFELTHSCKFVRNREYEYCRACDYGHHCPRDNV